MLESDPTKSCRNNHINTRRLLAAAWLAILIPFSANAIEIETPAVGLAGVPLAYTVTGSTPGQLVELNVAGERRTAMAGEDGVVVFADIVIAGTGLTPISAVAGDSSASVELRTIPGWVSVLPAVLAIAIALTLRRPQTAVRITGN